jgi:uncharacterized protein (TIGR03067 family)
MSRFIFVFVFVFAAIFAAAYMLMQQASSPSTAAQLAKNDESPAQNEEIKSANPTSASDPDEGTSASAKSGAFLKAKEGKKDVENVATAPKPDEPSVRTQGQRKQKSKRTIVKISPATPKPRETNGGIWDDDLDRLQGHWRMVDAEYDGNRIPDEASKYSWDFRVDQYTIKNNGNFQELWFVEVNSSRHLKTIDSTHDITRRKVMGIYEVTDDTLKVCYDLTGNGRPDSFKAAKGSRRACYYFER